MAVGNLLKRTLIVIHRYAGIPLSLMIIVWFVSGIVMMYAGGMPQLSANARLEQLPPLDLAAVRLTPAEAAERLGGRGLTSPTLTTILERPAYRFARGFGGTVTIFADTGERMDELAVDEARGVAARFVGLPEERLAFAETVERVDQWTLTMRNALPLHRFDTDDGTRVYVSPSAGRVELVTTPRSRALAWAGTIPHWLYFTPLRTNQPLWYWTVVWLAVAGCVLALLGLVLGIWQLRRPRPFKASAAIPYRGWMRWHHVTGLFFGLFALTWAFSGLLSMEPFDWTTAQGMNVRRDVFTGGTVALASYPAFDARAWRELLGDRTLKEVEFNRIHGDHYYAARFTRPAHAEPDGRRERLHQPYGVAGRNEPGRLLIEADTLRVRTEPFAADELVALLRRAVTEAAIVESDVLEEYDAFYYSRGGQAPLPVLRVKFDDPMETWLYVDLATSQPVAQIHRFNRLERWLYNGLHSLDFSFWYDKRPLWDIGMIVLSLGALATTSIGLVLGVQRIRRGTLRALRRLGAGRPRGGPGGLAEP